MEEASPPLILGQSNRERSKAKFYKIKPMEKPTIFFKDIGE
jgi:hypothetical protein